MKRDKLTKVERQFAENALPGLYDPNNPSCWSKLRSKMKEIAYHESGHIVAHMFTGLGSGDIIRVTIIPHNYSIGSVVSDRWIYEKMLPDNPEPIIRIEGRKFLLVFLAGRGAEARVATPENYEEILDEDALEEQEFEEGSDLFRALRVAKIMAQPKTPDQKILELAAKWTKEMLALPDVWQCVETLSDLLLKQGKIEDPEKITAICENIMIKGLTSPNWKERLRLTDFERKSIFVQD